MARIDSRHFILIALLSALAASSVSTAAANPADSLTWMPEDSVLMLEEVTVKGKSAPQRIREGQYNVNVVEIAPALNTSVSMTDIVGRTAGIKVRSEGGLGSDFDIMLNGLSGSAVRYFIDGVPLDTKGGNISLSNIPMNTIDRVEIYKGVVPPSLGADALGGAINLITRTQKDNFLDFAVSAGSYHTWTANATGQIVAAGGNLLIRPSVSYEYSKNDYMMRDVEVWDTAADRYILADRRRFNDRYRSLFSQLEVGTEHKPWARYLFITATYSTLQKGIQTGATQAIVYGDARRHGHSWSVSGRYAIDNLLVKRLNLSLFASHTSSYQTTVDTAFRKYDWNGHYTQSQRNEITGGPKSMLHYDRPMTVARGNLDYSFASHHNVNLNYILNNTKTHRFDDVDKTYRPSRDRLTKHILGLAYTQTLVDSRLVNTLFGKSYIENFKILHQESYNNSEHTASATKSFWGYGIGSRFSATDWLKPKASFEHTVRLPLSREILGNGVTVMQNLALKPESSDNVNVGILGDIQLPADNSLYYKVSGYWRDVSDMIHLVVGEADGTSYYTNLSSVRATGLETEVGWHCSDWLSLTTNWSYSETKDMNRWREDGKPSITYKNRIPNLPWLFGNTDLTFARKKIIRGDDRLRFGYTFQYVHWYYLTWEGYGSLSSKSKIPSQYRHDVSLTYSWFNERYNVTLELDNIFDCTLYDNYRLQKPGRFFSVKFRLFLR